jgi:hypothetical protein
MFDGDKSDDAYMRFLLNRNLNTRNWDIGKNGYDRCPFCKTEGTQNHFLLECRRCKSFTMNFFKKLDDKIKHVLPKKLHNQIGITN